MRWKVLLSLFVIIALVGLLLTTDVGRVYADFLRIRAGEAISGLQKYIPFFPRQPLGQSFEIILTADKGAFYGQVYALTNSSFSASGVRKSDVRVGNVLLSKIGVECEVGVESMRGKFDYTVDGVVKLSGSSSGVVVDGVKYAPTDKDLGFEFELVPLSMQLTGIEQDRLLLESVTGSIERLKEDGGVKSTENLYAERLEISGFVGYMKLEATTVVLRGWVNSVKGQNFSW